MTGGRTSVRDIPGELGELQELLRGSQGRFQLHELYRQQEAGAGAGGPSVAHALCVVQDWSQGCAVQDQGHALRPP